MFISLTYIHTQTHTYHSQHAHTSHTTQHNTTQHNINTHNTTQHNINTHNTHTSQDSTKIKLSPSKMSKENPRKCDETPLNDTTSVSAMHYDGTATAAAFSAAENRNDFLIKTEPESGGSTPACIGSPPLSSGNSAGGSKAPPSSLHFVPPPLASSNGRTGRNFSTPDAKRKCLGSNSRTSPLFGGKEEMEEEDDLKLNPDVFLSNVIRTPPIKALEEGDDPPITPSPTSVGPSIRRCPSNPPTNNSCTSNHSNPPSTPTAIGPSTSSSNNNSVNSNSNSSKMAEDLNEFYRVMEQVCEKESRLSSAVSTAGATSTQIDMYTMSPPPMVGTGGASQHVSPPPYNHPTSMRLPAGPRYGSGGGNTQHLHPAALTSPPAVCSPPFSTAAHSLYSTPLRGQQQPSLPLQQTRQPQPQTQAPPYPSTGQSSAHMGDMRLQFSDPPPSLLSQPAPSQHATAIRQTQQQLQATGKAPNQLEPQSHQQQLHLSHLTQHAETTARQVAAPPPPNVPISSHVFYSNSGPVQQRMHTSAAPLPLQQTPQTPTTPLEHYATFQTTQSSQISPTHGSNPLHHQALPGPSSYTYSPATSHFLPSNHIHNPYHQSMTPQHQQMVQHHSSAITVSTNSWGGHRQIPRVAYKDNMMVSQQAMVAGRSHMAALVRSQVPGQAEASLVSYPPMGLPSLQHHPTPPPAYLQSCRTTSHPNPAFSRLPFPPNMQ